MEIEALNDYDEAFRNNSSSGVYGNWRHYQVEKQNNANLSQFVKGY